MIQFSSNVNIPRLPSKDVAAYSMYELRMFGRLNQNNKYPATVFMIEDKNPIRFKGIR